MSHYNSRTRVKSRRQVALENIKKQQEKEVKKHQEKEIEVLGKRITDEAKAGQFINRKEKSKEGASVETTDRWSDCVIEVYSVTAVRRNRRDRMSITGKNKKGGNKKKKMKKSYSKALVKSYPADRYTIPGIRSQYQKTSRTRYVVKLARK